MGAFAAGAAALYLVAGLVTAVAFVTFGVKSVLPPSTTMTGPARVMLLPGAIALWPYVLYRWLSAPAAR
jgi:hypothetical protein